MSGTNSMTDKIEGTEDERPPTWEEAIAHDKVTNDAFKQTKASPEDSLKR